MFNARFQKLTLTWIEIEGDIYEAKSDERGPIGGGEGYRDMISGGDPTVSTLDALLEAMSGANSGEVIFIDGSAEINCTERVFIENQMTEIPGGGTLASDRGRDGSN